jgi:hypothetical protein
MFNLRVISLVFRTGDPLYRVLRRQSKKRIPFLLFFPLMVSLVPFIDIDIHGDTYLYLLF